MSNMLIALEITALGMGLVFATILLLWWMIHALTSVTAQKDSPSRQNEPVSAITDSTSPIDGELKAQAAAVAVAIALAELQASAAHPLSIPPTAMVSAWQLGMRTRQMYQKGIPTRRQPRETGR
ncbi:MAG TPA: OadG family protein [Anaerolineales bacterium]|nr:OadG family protein [Anaerolineales bacterium]